MDDDGLADDDSDFVLVKSQEYADGSLVLSSVTASASALAQRVVFLVLKFQRLTLVSPWQRLSANGRARFDAWSAIVPVLEYSNDMQLSVALFVRPRFFGAVRLIGSAKLDVVNDVVGRSAHDTPAQSFALSLARGVDVELSATFFRADQAPQLADFVARARELLPPLPPHLLHAAHAAPQPTRYQQPPALLDPHDEPPMLPPPAPLALPVEALPVRCLLCGAETVRELALVLDCAHAFCAECLHANVAAQLAANPDAIEIRCPKSGQVDCGNDDGEDHDDDDDDDDDDDERNENPALRRGDHCNVSQWALRVILPPEQFDALLGASLRRATSDDGAFFQCPAAECGAVMERLEPLPLSAAELRASKQAALSSSSEERELAARHRELHRFRCRACRTEFCAQCKAVPFHDEFTCASFRRFKESKRCRFCDAPMTRAPDSAAPPALRLVCDDAACVAKAAACCASTLAACGHACGGVRDEPASAHLRCLVCADAASGEALGGEWCGICYVDPLQAAPAIELECGHVFHASCVAQRLRAEWAGAVIAFQYIDCPLCAKPIAHASLREQLAAARQFKEQVEAKANQRLVFEGLARCAAVVDAASRFHNKPTEYAMSRYAYYRCFKCKQAYFGGQKSCQDAAAQQQQQQQQQYDPSELVCPTCAGSGNESQRCAKHGEEFIEFKCQFCCAVAAWFCWGKTHFCDACHTKQRAGDYLTRKPVDSFATCGSRERCPLRIAHPRNGTQVATCLGCAVCRQEASF